MNFCLNSNMSHFSNFIISDENTFAVFNHFKI